VLLGRRFAVDPQFGGEEKGVTGPTGLRASDLNMDVANHLARFLRTCGADVVLTREADETVSALRRVEIAEEFGAEWFISIGHGSTAKPELAETDGAVEGTAIEEIKIFHYPTSLPGAQLAAAIANTVEHGAIASSVAVQPDTSFVLTHTSSPAVRIRGLDLSIPEIEERFRHPGTARNEAYAIYCGILENFGLTENETGEVAVRVLDKAGNGVANALLNLDESFTLQTGARGEFTLYRLTPGNHRLQVFAGGPPLWSGSISIKAGGKLVVTISVSDATAQSTAEAM
jgi:N-acetylmuramoyl-L-alanine amidase